MLFVNVLTTKAKDPHAILKARYLVLLLSAQVPPLRVQMSNLLLLFLTGPPSAILQVY